MGPSTEDDDILRSLIRAGMTVARLNFSHGDHDYHRQHIERVRRISAELGIPVAIMGDTKGPEIRTRLNEGHEPVLLSPGSEVTVTTRDMLSTSVCVSVDYEALPDKVAPDYVIYMDDGLIALRVLDVEGRDIHCVVVNGGLLGERKGVNLPNVVTDLPAVSEQDLSDLAFACEMGVDAIAASFVCDADAVRSVREVCRQHGRSDILIIAKVESALAVSNFDEILRVSDGIMVARGDLGIEIPPAEVPHTQKEIVYKCNAAYRPVIIATQMLDSMVRSPRPTRAEATDVANAIYDGADCVMLSGETAAGAFPVESVEMMAEVCRQSEQFLVERDKYHEREGYENVSGATGFAAVQVAKLVGASALLCPTNSGSTACIVATFRPRLPIIAASPNEDTVRRMGFVWGVIGVLAQEKEWLAEICRTSLSAARKAGLVKADDLVVVTAGDPLTSPFYSGYRTTTNVCMVAQVI